MKSKVANFLRFFLLTGLLLLAFKPFPKPNSTVINISVDATAGRSSISPYIYGLNFAKESFANEINLPVRRWGGNATSRYNWETNNLNSANDWYFENSTNTNAYDWGIAETYEQWIKQNERTATNSLITIPMLEYVAKNGTSCSFSVSKYGLQTDVDPWKTNCGSGILQSNGNAIINDPADASVAVNSTYMQNWVAAMVSNHGTAATNGVKFYALDNEPELWSETHRDVHPTDQTYDELLAKTIDYGEAIKSADPTASILGYTSFGWSGYWYSWHDLQVAADNGYTYFPDYATHGNMYQVEWYLNSMHQYELDHGTRLLDYLDLHFYPENGVALRTVGNSTMKSLRLRSTRALWDPTYRDESWIGGGDQAADQRYIRLIPRMKAWVNTYYPGTKLAITEYNFGGLENINGALAQADALGIFGREGLDMATLWNYPLPNDVLGYDHFEELPGAYAFRMYRNYDGIGGKFGDISINASSADPSQLSIYAAQRNSDSALTLMIINKTGGTLSSAISISNFLSDGYAQTYEYSASNPGGIIRKADLFVNTSNISAAFPANSITVLVIPTHDNTHQTGIFTSSGMHDGHILESTETSGTGGMINSTATTFNLGDATANRQYRAILHFDTSSLPDNAVILFAALKIKKYSQIGSNPFSILGNLRVDVRTPSFGTTALALNDFKSPSGKNNIASFSITPSNNWYSAVLNNAGRIYINRVGNTQFRLYFMTDDNNDFGNDYVKFYSGNAGTTQRPQLIIKYYTPGHPWN